MLKKMKTEQGLEAPGRHGDTFPLLEHMLRASLLEPQYLPEEKTNNCGRERGEKERMFYEEDIKPSGEVSQVKPKEKITSIQRHKPCASIKENQLEPRGKRRKKEII